MTHKYRQIFLIVLMTVVWLLPIQQLYADQANTPLLTAASQALSVEQARNALFANKLQAMHVHTKQALISTQITPVVLRQADLAISLASADLDGINLTLTAAQEAAELAQNNLQALQDQLANTSVISSGTAVSNAVQKQLQAQVTEQQALYDLQAQRINTLQNTQNFALQTLEAAQEWKTQLQSSYYLQQQLNRQQALDRLAVSLQQEQHDWLTRLSQLNKQLETNNKTGVQINSPTYVRLEMGIFEAEEQSNLSQVQLDLARLHSRLEDLAAVPEQKLSLTLLNSAQQQVTILLQQLTSTTKTLNNKIELLQRRIQITNGEMQTGIATPAIGQANLSMLYGLLGSYKIQLATIKPLTQKAYATQAAIIQKLNDQLASRQGLPGFNRTGWLLLTEKIVQIPSLTWQVLRGLDNPVISAVHMAEIWQWGLWILAIAAWGVIWARVRRYLAVAEVGLGRHAERLLTTNTMLLICVRLLNAHLPALMLLGGFIGLLVFMGIPLQTFGLVIGLASVGIVFSLTLGLTRLLLLEHGTDRVKDAKLYHRLKWILLIAGVITALTVWVHQLPIVYDIQDLFDRMFMLLLLLLGLVLLRAWAALPTFIQTYVDVQRPYLKRLVRWLTLLIPLALLFNAVIGLIGYVELAWSIAIYEGLFLMVAAGYFLLSGILNESAKYAAQRVIRQWHNGWLWSEAILKPLHLVLRIILLLIALTVLFKLYGWDKESWMVTHINHFLNLELFTIAGTIIRPFNLLQLLIIAGIFVWLTRWTREFTYRWIFANLKDLGLRNSLAIFSQYAMVAIGVIIAFHITGVNLTALTMILSAFAVGVGFGLRDLANNFMSGILLLIERPVEVGDYVTIGTYNGEVKHIGMRSITVTTDDHQELLVPNANVFSQAFINWTHRDSIVRSVISLKINRIDDPHRVQEIIFDVLKSIPKVLKNPLPQVYLKELDDVLLKFQVGYYVDMHGISLTEARSQVLYAIWDRFAAEGIHPPDTSYDVRIIEGEIHS